MIVIFLLESNSLSLSRARILIFSESIYYIGEEEPVVTVLRLGRTIF